jgi:hypothetical protein
MECLSMRGRLGTHALPARLVDHNDVFGKDLTLTMRIQAYNLSDQNPPDN